MGKFTVEDEIIDNSQIGEWLFDDEPHEYLMSSIAGIKKRWNHVCVSSRNEKEFRVLYRYFYKISRIIKGPVLRTLEKYGDYQWTFIYHKGVLKIGKSKPYAYVKLESNSTDSGKKTV